MQVDLNALLSKLLCDDRAPSGDGGPWQLGNTYLVRTVTMTIVGRLAQVYDKELVFQDAAWVADTGRFADALKDPSVLKEVEPFANDAIVGRGAIVDATVFPAGRLSQK